MIALPRSRRGVDIAVGVVCWAVAVGVATLVPLDPSMALSPVGGRAWWVLALVLTGQAIALAWTARHPRVVVATVAVTPLLVAGLAPTALFSVTSLAVMVAVYLMVSRSSLRTSMPTVVSAAAAVLLSDVVNRTSLDGSGLASGLIQSVLQTATVIGLPVLVGSVVAARRDARVAHGRELRAAEGERDARVSAAIAGERAAMARELHDIAAHHLSGIAVMAAAVGRQIESDPDTARRSADEIRVQARAVLDDLRQLVGLLREDTASAERSVETLGSIDHLVGRRRASGLDVELRLVGLTDLEALGERVGPLAQLVAFRMVQESLTNAVRHAPGSPCVVEVSAADSSAVTVTVSNPMRQSAGTAPRQEGFGLIGMRERAVLVGGHVHHGPTADGRWTVTLQLPREPDNVGEHT
ncbi:sensor histidine kinase [Rhodococcus sp. BP-349]|uniref:sensor histidine kinase n=1 Tax=unclassified Rhodococcus (in: high G+C Gram-positive bacteria) TaxID=192944 RepID=UPI001C9B4293|nr:MULTISPECIES: histidine kinase [unclassified Rhodococcus (in: high G+C Gram-positive bacteria)]MBY6538003.1 sensor histidine kinase [Rhodococcus sp. BP-363]MBY6542340.1 sensor histidine kinase [Rhodococcus sp. BP-369]MBY6561570.1 sensor histidine kinase [Rhodococcus sp. BP-370]MBY6575862.1 sensor histidine kinase [Rhodococcus sp. BP-364]MBY6585163.1 sensor histidine kinase [Rhodococcus sp. BP-358]